MGPPASPMGRLAAPPDPRDRRDSPEALPGLAVVAMTAGMTSPEAIAHLGRLRGTRLTHLLGFRDGDTPCKATDSQLVAAPDVAAVEAALAAWVRDRLHKPNRLGNGPAAVGRGWLPVCMPPAPPPACPALGRFLRIDAAS